VNHIHALALLHLKATALKLTNPHKPLYSKEVIAKAFAVVVKALGCCDDKHGVALSCGVRLVFVMLSLVFVCSKYLHIPRYM